MDFNRYFMGILEGILSYLEKQMKCLASEFITMKPDALLPATCYGLYSLKIINIKDIQYK